MEKPKISADFTIEDIHKIREYLYEETKGMTVEQMNEYYRPAVDRFMAKVEAKRASQNAAEINIKESSDPERHSEEDSDIRKKTLLDKARKNYEYAEKIHDEMCADIANLIHVGFWLAQAVELAMKYLFEAAGADQPETHDVDQIIRIAKERDVNLYLTRYVNDHSEMLTLWAERQEDPGYEVERWKVEQALKGVQEYFEFIGLGLATGKVFTTDLRHERPLRAALDVIKTSDFRKYIKTVFLFGSCARDQQEHRSDVDLGLVTAPGILEDQVLPALKHEYRILSSEISGVSRYDAEVEPHVFYEGGEESAFKENAAHDAIILWENPDYDPEQDS